jgi:hypothetical protein
MLIINALVCLILGIFSIEDVKYRCVNVRIFNGFYFTSLVILTCLNIYLYRWGCLLAVLLAFISPFLLWFFNKSKFGAVDARSITLCLLICASSLYLQLLYMILLFMITLICFLISKFVTKSYDKVGKEGGKMMIPELVPITVSLILLTIIIW